MELVELAAGSAESAESAEGAEGAEAVGESGACYICFEEGAPKAPCRCVDRFVHAACQQKEVEATGRAACAVCNAPWPHMQIKRTPARCTRRGKRFVATGALFLVMATLSLVFFFPLYEWRGARYAYYATLIGINTSALYMFFEIMQHLRGGWKFLHMRVVVSVERPCV